MCVLSRIQLLVILGTIARQAPLSMGFPRQEYWSGLPFSPPGDLPDPGISPESPASPALAGGFFTTRANWGALRSVYVSVLFSQFVLRPCPSSPVPTCLFSIPALKIKSLLGCF